MNQPRKPSHHRVLMNYMHRDGYVISFLEEDCKTTLRKKLTFADASKILEMHERWGEDRTDEYLSRLKQDMAIGRPGGIWLTLSAEQYAKLK